MKSSKEQQVELRLVVNTQRVNSRTDYKKLYHDAYNQLTDLHRIIEKVQQELENLYLEQTEPRTLPEHIRKVDQL